MEKYTIEEGQKLIDFYSSQIIGKQISSDLHESYKVTSLVFELVDKKKGFVYCLSNHNFDIFKRNLLNYINDFKLIHPSDVLKN